MFDKEEYKAAMACVKASPETRMEVLNMTERNNKERHSGIRRAVALAAAVVALMAMAVTAFAAEDIASWFRSYFSRTGKTELSQAQVEYLNENEQIIAQSQTNNGWTVELRSALHDDSTGYIILAVTGPEDVVLPEVCVENDADFGNLTFGNTGMTGHMADLPDILLPPEGVLFSNWGYTWQDDGDGLENTKDLVIHFNPNMEKSTVEPFGNEAVYGIYLKDIVIEYEDKAYRQELMDGKYAGQTDVAFTSEETQRLFCVETISEGVWDFSIVFDQGSGSERCVELLREPVTVTASIFRRVGSEITDYEDVQDSVTLTSVVVRHLTVTFTYDDCDGMPSFERYEEDDVTWPCVVLKDGTQLRLVSHGAGSSNTRTLEADQPIIFEDVDYILMTDGTRIPMPE